MKTLKELQELGVRELRVAGGQAVAVNPYTNPKLSDYEAWGDIEIWKSTHNPLPCAESVKEGTYPIGEFEPEYQFWHDEYNDWYNVTEKQFYGILKEFPEQRNRIVLVLSEPVAESEKPNMICPVTNEHCNDYCRITGISCKPDEVAEKPEGENPLVSAEEFFGDYDFGISDSDLPGFYKAVDQYAAMRVVQALEKVDGDYFVLIKNMNDYLTWKGKK